MRRWLKQWPDEYRSRNAVMVLLSAWVVIMVSGCGAAGQYGQAIPDTAARVTLAEVLANPLVYDEKTVVLQGTVSSQCEALCNFIYQEDSAAVDVVMQGFKPSRVKRGTAVTLYARVTASKERAALTALGVRFHKERGHE